MSVMFSITAVTAGCAASGDIRGGGVAHVLAVPDHVPVLVASVDPHGGPVGDVGDHGGAGAGAAAQIQGAADVYRALPGVCGPDEGNVKKVREAENEIPGNLRQAVLDPAGVLVVVVIAQLQQHGGEFRVPHLAKACGGPGDHLVGQGVDAAQVVDKDLRGPLALGAGGVVEGDDAAHIAVVVRRGGVGVEGQIEVVPAGVGLPDGAAGGHVGRVALVADAAAVEIGDHGVRQAVHPVLLAAGAGDIGVVFLCGWAEVDNGHGW